MVALRYEAISRTKESKCMKAGRQLRSLVVVSSFLGSALLGEAETNTLKCSLARHALSTVTWCDGPGFGEI